MSPFRGDTVPLTVRIRVATLSPQRRISVMGIPLISEHFAIVVLNAALFVVHLL